MSLEAKSHQGFGGQLPLHDGPEEPTNGCVPGSTGIHRDDSLICRRAGLGEAMWHQTNATSKIELRLSKGE